MGPRRGRIEINTIIKINGIKVGIESRGDKALIISDSLNEFAEASCKIIVCACRRSGKTLSALRDFAETRHYDVEWLDKEKSSTADQAMHETANDATAAQIVSAVQAALGA